MSQKNNQKNNQSNKPVKRPATKEISEKRGTFERHTEKTTSSESGSNPPPKR